MGRKIEGVLDFFSSRNTGVSLGRNSFDVGWWAYHPTHHFTQSLFLKGEMK
jgi:hypothetical protein